jgi:hypothetical protein
MQLSDISVSELRLFSYGTDRRQPIWGNFTFILSGSNCAVHRVNPLVILPTHRNTQEYL